MPACQKRLIHVLHCLICQTWHKYKCYMLHTLCTVREQKLSPMCFFRQDPQGGVPPPIPGSVQAPCQQDAPSLFPACLGLRAHTLSLWSQASLEIQSRKQRQGEKTSFPIECWRVSVRTVVLDLQRDELRLQGPFGGRAIHTEVNVCEKREWCSCEPTATPDASGDDVVWTFLHVFQFHVPRVE